MNKSLSFLQYCRAVAPSVDYANATFLLANAVTDYHIAEINMPPQHGASTLALLRMAFELGRYSKSRIAYLTYSLSIADRRFFQLLAVVHSAEHQRFFPNSQRFSAPSLRSQVILLKASSPADGGTFDLVVIDDPFADMATRCSPSAVQSLGSQVMEMANHSALDGEVLVLNARLPEGWLQSRVGAGVHTLNLPAISADGDTLMPHVHSLDVLMAKKACMGADCWDAMYQQDGAALLRAESAKPAGAEGISAEAILNEVFSTPSPTNPLVAMLAAMHATCLDDTRTTHKPLTLDETTDMIQQLDMVCKELERLAKCGHVELDTLVTLLSVRGTLYRQACGMSPDIPIE